MNLIRAARLATFTTVALWIIDDGIIAVTDKPEGLLDSICFLLGLVACVAATVLIGVAAFARRSLGWRVLGVVLGVVVVSGVGGLAQVIVSAVQPTHPGWVYGEINLWVIMLALLAAAASLGAREDTRDRDRGARARAGAGSLS